MTEKVVAELYSESINNYKEIDYIMKDKNIPMFREQGYNKGNLNLLKRN